MVGLFIFGGIAGLLSATVALISGASWLVALGLYVGVGMLFPAFGMLHINFGEDDALFDSGDRLEDTYAQWAADPEGQPADHVHEEGRTSNSRVA